MICYKYVLKCPGDLRSNRYINDLAAVCNSLLFCHFAFAARKRVFTPKYYSVGSEPKISKPRFSGEFPLFRPCAFDLVCQVFKSYAFLFFSKSQYGCVLLTDIRRKMRRLLKRLFPRVSGGDAFSAPSRAPTGGEGIRAIHIKKGIIKLLLFFKRCGIVIMREYDLTFYEGRGMISQLKTFVSQISSSPAGST